MTLDGSWAEVYVFSVLVAALVLFLWGSLPEHRVAGPLITWAWPP